VWSPRDVCFSWRLNSSFPLHSVKQITHPIHFWKKLSTRFVLPDAARPGKKASLLFLQEAIWQYLK
jgi:hypothetical protein